MKLLPLLLLAISPLCALGTVVLQDNAEAVSNGPVKTQGEGWAWSSCGEHDVLLDLTSLLIYCLELFINSPIKKGQSSDPLQIQSIQVSPDPPKPGENMTVTVNAIAQERIEVRIGSFF